MISSTGPNISARAAALPGRTSVEDRRLEEVTRQAPGSEASAAQLEARAFLRRMSHLSLEATRGLEADERSEIGVGLDGIADFQEGDVLVNSVGKFGGPDACT